jgi:hypothetical protein
MSKKQFCLWHNEFKKGHVNISDEPRNGRLSIRKINIRTSCTRSNVFWLTGMWKFKQWCRKLVCPSWLCMWSFTSSLDFKVCACWVLKQLAISQDNMHDEDVPMAEVPKLWGAPPPRGRCSSSGRGGGANCLYEGHTYFEWNMDAR